MTPPAPTPRTAHNTTSLIAGFFLLLLMVLMSVWFAARERAAAAADQAALLNRDHLSDLLSTVRQAESGLRGYMLTGNEKSLVTYNLALNAIAPEFQLLDAPSPAGPDPADLNNLHQLVATKLAQLQQVAAAIQAGDKAGAVTLVNDQLNLGTMQDVRDLVGRMEARQTARFNAIQSTADWNSWVLQLVTGLAAFGALMLAWLSISTNRARTGALIAAEAALIDANEALEHKVEERTRTLRASEALFRTLAESLPGFVAMTGPIGQPRYINPQFTAFTGMSAETLQSAGWAKALHPDDIISGLPIWKNYIAAGAPFDMEYRFRRHDGVYRWFLSRSTPITDETGTLTGWIGSFIDIDERKQAEAVLADTNAILEQRVIERTRELDRIFRLSTDILVVSDHTGKFLNLNPAWERIIGHSVADSLGKSYVDFSHPDDLSDTAGAQVQLREGQPLTGFENRFRRADGSWCWLSWRAVPLPEEGIAYSIGRDVTQEKAREEQLRQSQKMEVVGQLTGGIAHDFNNLLTIIMGSLELLERGFTNADPKQRRRMEAAMDGARRAAALTHRLLAFSRRQPLAPQTINANRLLAGMSDMLYRTLGEAVAIEIVAAAGLWPALADANQLENAILNLAVNARDAMPDGGHLTIETQNTYLDETYATAKADLQPGQYVEIAVTDTGTGMTADVQGKIFEPFFTTKPQGKGTGLGLAQVYGFIKQSEGHVAIYSEPGQGTTVKLYLPRLRTMPEADIEMPEPEPQAESGFGETILLVEDEDGVRNFSIEILEELGYNVLPAKNADDALEIFETANRVDLLFTDVVLSGSMNGRLLANKILESAPDTIVLFTTGYTRNAIIHHGRLDEGINFLGKPFTASALGLTIRKLLDKARVKQDLE